MQTLSLSLENTLCFSTLLSQLELWMPVGKALSDHLASLSLLSKLHSGLAVDQYKICIQQSRRQIQSLEMTCSGAHFSMVFLKYDYIHTIANSTNHSHSWWLKIPATHSQTTWFLVHPKCCSNWNLQIRFPRPRKAWSMLFGFLRPTELYFMATILHFF